MAIATLVCSIISALIAVINVTITVWSSILDIISTIPSVLMATINF